MKNSDPKLLSDLLHAKSPKDLGLISSAYSSYFKECAVVFLDLSGFGKISESCRDFECLRLILISETLIQKFAPEYDGFLLKSIGDSWLLKFKNVQDGLKFLQALYEGLDKLNTENPQHLASIPCGGIAYGSLLTFGDSDILGRTVNVAAKAGEDTAGPWEVLIAESALSQVEFNAKIKLTGHNICNEKVYSWLPLQEKLPD